MKFGSVTKLDTKNKTTTKKFDDAVMLANCDVIFIFSIYGRFGEIRKPAKNPDISKGGRALVLKGIFSETTYVCVLTYQISSF